jgi:hypothetical protein
MSFLVIGLYISIAGIFGFLFRSCLIYVLALVVLSNFFKRFLFISSDPGRLYTAVLLIPDFFLLFYIAYKIKHLLSINKTLFFFLFSLFVTGTVFLSNILISVAYIKMFVIYIFFFFLGKEAILKKGFGYDFFKDKFSVFLFIIIIFATAYIFLQWSNNYFPFEKAWITSGSATVGANYLADMGVYRYMSIFSGFREAAIYFIIGILFLYYSEDTILKGPVKWLGYACLVVGILLAGSRGTLVGLVIALIAKHFITNKKRAAWLIGCLLCAFIVLYFNVASLNVLDALVGDVVKNRYLNRMIFSSSLGGRVLGWYDIIQNHLFWGAGLGAYTSAASLGKDANLGADSQFLSFLGQGGIFLLFAYLVIIYSILKMNFVDKKTNSIKNNPSINIVIIILLLIIFDSLFNPTLDSRATSVIFWYYLGVLYYSKGQTKSPPVLTQFQKA